MGRVLILGLDGFGYDFAARAFARGDMPFLAARAGEGAFGPAASTVPPVSTAAWTTLATGVGIGRHGVVDFRRREMANYGFVAPGRLVSSRDVRARPLYDLASAAGLRSLVVNLPVSYPAREINGVMVTGVLTPPGSERGFWPPSFGRRLAGYAYDLDEPAPADLGSLCRRLEDITAGRVRVVEAACAEGRFDFGLVVFTGPDRVFHRFYNEVYAADELPAAAARYLRALDDACGCVSEVFGADAALLVCSDHGFRPGPAKNFFLNRLLRRAGLFAPGGGSDSYALNYILAGLRRLFGGGKPLPVDWRRTAAYGFPVYMGWGGVVLNMRGEQPEGSVAPEDAAKITAEVRDALTAARDGGAAVCRWVKAREEIYDGPAVGELPHLIFEAAPAYAVSEAKGPGPLVGPYANPLKAGEHAPEAMFFAAGPGIKRGKVAGATLADVAATAARLLGLDAGGLDGSPLAGVTST